MSYLCLAVLYLLVAYAGLEGFISLSEAKTSFHQIYGVIWLVVVTVGVSGIGIIHALVVCRQDGNKQSSVFNNEATKQEAATCKSNDSVASIEQVKTTEPIKEEATTAEESIKPENTTQGISFKVAIAVFIIIAISIVAISYSNQKGVKVATIEQKAFPLPAPSTYEMPTTAEQHAELEAKMKNGDTKAKLTLAYAFAYGNGTEEKNKGIVLFKQLANEGNPYAQYEIGKALYEGKGVRQDKEDGLQYLQKAANQGHQPSKKFLTEYR